MSRILIQGGRLIDPESECDEILDVLIENGRIAKIGLDINASGAAVLDASGCWVTPGFIDLHTHLREPGLEYKEDIASGGRAAAAGGFTCIACMANTDPVNDDPAVTDYILDRAKQDSPIDVLPIAAATKGLEGKVMTEMDTLFRAGAVAFSDDGRTIMDGEVMRRVLDYSRMVNVPIIVHAEDRALVADGVVNEGPVSTRLGLPGNPCVAESVHVARDLLLAELTGAHLHIGHVSTSASVDLIRDARLRGVRVTAEATPHHLCLTDEATLGYNTDTKVAPPLRSELDREACVRGLIEGTIDAIATDHAPHADHEKEEDFVNAPHGMIGLETAFPVVLELVRNELLSPLELVDRMTSKPAKILNCGGGSVAVGSEANVTVANPNSSWIYDPTEGYSKSRNSPWAGKTLVGQIRFTICKGEVVFDIDRGVLHP